MHWLNLIIGFLYIGLINRNIKAWKEQCQNLTKLLFCIKKTLLEIADQKSSENADQKSSENALKKVYCQITTIYETRSIITAPCHFLKSIFGEDTLLKKKVNACIALETVISKMTEVKQKTNLINISESICMKCYNKEPLCFTFHNGIILVIFFALMPVDLFKSIVPVTTVIKGNVTTMEYGQDEILHLYWLYPLIIYLLYSIVILAKVFQNPMEHMGVDPSLKMLHDTVFKKIFPPIEKKNQTEGKTSKEVFGEYRNAGKCKNSESKYKENDDIYDIDAGLALRPMPTIASTRYRSSASTLFG